MDPTSAMSKIQLKRVNVFSKIKNKTRSAICIVIDCNRIKSGVLKNQCGFSVAGKKGLTIKITIVIYKTIL